MVVVGVVVVAGLVGQSVLDFFMITMSHPTLSCVVVEVGVGL